MTKNRKIAILVKEINELNKENKRLHDISSEKLSNDMLKEIKRYSRITDRLCDLHKKLNELRFMGLKNRLKYRRMMCGVKIRRMLGI